jgi:hypothetical protein
MTKYCDTPSTPGQLSHDSFVVIPAYSSGGLHANTRALLADLAAACEAEFSEVAADFVSGLMRAQALTLSRQLQELG